MANESLKKLYVEQLKDLYSAENQILEALPQMASAASHQELRSSFEMHEQQTREQVKRLEAIFDDLGEKPSGHKCKAMEGIVAEGKETMKTFKDSDVLDAALIAAAQRVEHYEIAGYGTVRTYAQELGMTDHVQRLQTTLDEEGQTDQKLTRLAERAINPDAMR